MKKKTIHKKTLQLTFKQQKFVDEYLINGGNGTQAAKKAGYKGNDHTLHSIATENLRKPAVKAYIDKRRVELAGTAKVTQEMIVEELKAIAFSNIHDVMDKNNQIKNVSELDRSIASTIESVQTTSRRNGEDNKIEVTNVKIKQYNKLDAIKQLVILLGYDKSDKGNVMFNIIINKY